MAHLFIDESTVHLVRELGKGTYGSVWEAECAGSVAVKILGDKAVEDLTTEEFENLKNEVTIMTNNPHPNIMLAMGLCTIQGKLAIVMELLDGDLHNLLIKSGAGETLSLFQRLCLAKKAAEALQWLHRRDIIHRDLKLENLMYKKLGNSFIVKVADFGLAVVKPPHKKGLRSEALGTPLTMAPEIMMEKPFHQKADVYSFAMCLWQIATCKPLFPNYRDYEAFERAICEDQERPEIPKWMKRTLPSLAKLLKRCWSHKPKKRPDFAEINDKLTEILIEAAISDSVAREFWTSAFAREHKPKWDAFAKELFEFLALPLPDSEGAMPDSARQYNCLRALLETEKQADGMGVVDIENFGRFLQYYGPMDPRGMGAARHEWSMCERIDDEDDSDNELSASSSSSAGDTSAAQLRALIAEDRRHTYSLAQRAVLLLRQPWFHGDIDEVAAMRLLDGKEAGTFLVRCSKAVGQFTVSRLHNGKMMSTRLSQSDQGFTVEDPNFKKYFPSLHELVDFLEQKFKWTPCPGSKYKELFPNEGEEDRGRGAYTPLF